MNTNYFDYTVYDLKNGVSIKQHIQKYKNSLNDNYISKELIGINIGMIDELEYQTREEVVKSIDINNIKFLFEEAIKNKDSWIKFTADNIDNLNMRGVGKTQLLVDLSKKYNIPIYSNNGYYDLLDKAKKLNLNPIIVRHLNSFNMAQYKNHDIILVDEIENIKSDSTNLKNRIIIGFETVKSA
jgi:hypothetical protein